MNPSPCTATFLPGRQERPNCWRISHPGGLHLLVRPGSVMFLSPCCQARLVDEILTGGSPSRGFCCQRCKTKIRNDGRLVATPTESRWRAQSGVDANYWLELLDITGWEAEILLNELDILLPELWDNLAR